MIMKKLMSIGFVLLFSFFMVSCGGGGSENPQDVAKSFMKALEDKDYDKAKDLGTENTVMMIGMIESMAGLATDTDKEPAQLTWGETEVDGDKATCFYTSSDKEGNQQVDLVKVDGDWKVDMKKEQ